MPSSNDDKPLDDMKEIVTRLRNNAQKWKRKGYTSPDYGKLSVEALNRHTSSPEFTAKYKAWSEFLGPKQWTPVARADYETMCKEEVAPDLIAKCRAELGVTSVAVARAEEEYEKMKTEEASTEAAKRTEPKK